MAAVAEGRSVLGAAAAAVEAIMANTARLTPEARRADAAALVAERQARIERMAGEARRRLVVARAVLDAYLERITAASNEELAAAREDLRLGFAQAERDPSLLLNTYRNRHRDPAARRVIERQAQGIIDTLGDSDNFAFRNNWDALQEELAATRSPEELEANTRRQELDALALYVDAAESVAMIDLALMDPAAEMSSDERERLQISRSMAEATVNQYENEYAPPAVV